jgi:protein-S-isoprenylcysteine O-methyltransferase Ste14
MSAASKGKAKKAVKTGSLPQTQKRVLDVDTLEEGAPDSSADTRDHAATSSPSAKQGETAYRGSSPGGHATGKHTTIWQRATYRWTAVTVVMAALLLLYSYHPYYKNQQFTPFKTIFPPAFVLWLGLGLFYVRATLEKFSERRYTMRDGGLHLLLLAKVAFEDVLSRAQWYAVAIFGGGAAVLGAARGLGTSLPPALRPLGTSDWAGAVCFLSALLAVILLSRGLRPKRLWRVMRNPRVRTTLLGICVKAFFTPLMTGFVVGHLNGISRAWLTHKHLPAMDFKVPNGASILTSVEMWWTHVGRRLGDLIPSGHDLAGLVQPWTWTRADVSWGLGLSYDIIFAIDCGWALFGYASESRWLGNKTRSVEPTAFGWLVCISCYPPFNNVLGTYLPLENGPQIVTGETAQLVLRAGVVFLFAIYASATVAFGFKFSNLTNRGIVTRGPYKYVRHPAYLCKCAAWWLEHVPTMTIVKAFFLSLLCGWYALRAWTEERHLGRDPEYREYKKKTPWVLFPGVY